MFLEGEAPKKSFGNWTSSIKLFVYIENNGYPIRWVAVSTIRAVQSLQLQQIGPLETYCFPTLAVNKLTKNAILN